MFLIIRLCTCRAVQITDQWNKEHVFEKKKKQASKLTFFQWNWTIFSCALKEHSTSGHCKRFQKDYSMFSTLLHKHVILVILHSYPIYMVWPVPRSTNSKTELHSERNGMLSLQYNHTHHNLPCEWAHGVSNVVKCPISLKLRGTSTNWKGTFSKLRTFCLTFLLFKYPG